MILATKEDYIDFINHELGKKKLFNQHELKQIKSIMDDMDSAYNHHNVVSLEILKKKLFDYINDLVIRKITEQQMEEVEKLKEKGVNNE